MAYPLIRRLQNITEQELKDILAVCLRAYKDDVATPAMIGGREELRPLLFSSMLRAGAIDGHLYVLEVDGKIVSVSLWFSPGHRLWSSEESRRLGFYELMEKLDEDTKDWWNNIYGVEVEKFVKQTIQVPFEYLWWTNVLATDPAQQKRGYASMMMQYVWNNEIVPPAYSGLCAISQENERFYNRLGYSTQGFMTLPSRFNTIPVYSLLRQI